MFRLRGPLPLLGLTARLLVMKYLRVGCPRACAECAYRFVVYPNQLVDFRTTYCRFQILRRAKCIQCHILVRTITIHDLEPGRPQTCWEHVDHIRDVLSVIPSIEFILSIGLNRRTYCEKVIWKQSSQLLRRGSAYDIAIP